MLDGDSRDDNVREDAAVGLPIGRIQKLTGLAATTIQRLLNTPPRHRRKRR